MSECGDTGSKGSRIIALAVINTLCGWRQLRFTNVLTGGSTSLEGSRVVVAFETLLLGIPGKS